MPPGRGKKPVKSSAPRAPVEHALCAELDDLQGDEISGPEDSPVSDIPSITGNRKRQRADLQGQGVGNEVQSLLTTFGADISKTLENKRKRLETFTQSSVKASGKKVEEIWRKQQQERMTLGEEYKKQVETVLSQFENDLVKSKAEEEGLRDFFKQTEKAFQQQRVVQTQRMKTIRKLHEQYTKGMQELDAAHQVQQTTMQSELKKEMALLQKKILMETQQQELSNVRRSLQSMLAQV